MKNLFNKSLPLAALLACMAVAPVASAQQAMTMDQLLRAVEQGRVQDNKENKEREAKFRAARADRSRAGGDALELSVLAGVPFRGAGLDGRQHRALEARLERPALRAGDRGGVQAGRVCGRLFHDPARRIGQGRTPAP